MDQKLFSKLNLYDQIGYLMVGGMALILAIADLKIIGIQAPVFDLENSIVWLVVAYATGHLAQGIANILIRENKDDFNDEQKAILEKARVYFDVKDRDSDIWNICNMLATAKDITGQVQQFNSYYSLYRGWSIVFLLESIFLAVIAILNFSWVLIAFLIVVIFCTWIFYRRSKRFWLYLRSKSLQTFLIVTKLDL